MMQDRVTYEYVVVRLVPLVEREEFINVGVLLFSKKKKYLGLKYKIDQDKINAFAKEIDIDLVKDYLDAWKKICDGAPSGGKIGELDTSLRFRWIAASKSTIIQCSKPHSGLCHDPKMVLEELYDRFVS